MVNVYADSVLVLWTGCEFAGCKWISTNQFHEQVNLNRLIFTKKTTNSLFCLH